MDGVGLQVRHKTADDRTLLELCRNARSQLPSTLTVNGRPDLALLANLEGVHLPADGLPTRVARQILGSTQLIGRSTHALDEVLRARDEGVDFVFFGPVFPSPSKPWAAATGLDRLRDACLTGVAVFALGGISCARLESVAAAGATGAAGIEMFNQEDLGVLAQGAQKAFRRRAES